MIFDSPIEFPRQKAVVKIGKDKSSTCSNQSCDRMLQCTSFVLWIIIQSYNIGIKHSFSCINIRQVPREVLKNVRSLLLHKN